MQRRRFLDIQNDARSLLLLLSAFKQISQTLAELKHSKKVDLSPPPSPETSQPTLIYSISILEVRMKSSVASLGPSTRKITARIKKVRRAAKKAAARKQRFADYRYLRAVLRAYEHFESNDLLDHLAEIAPSVLMTAERSGQHPLRTIIDASCDQSDLRIRSRWTRALQYAVIRQVRPADLPRFFRANNGIAGCADLASKTSPSRRSPNVRISPTTVRGRADPPH